VFDRSQYAIAGCSVLTAVLAVATGADVGGLLVLLWSMVATGLMIRARTRHTGRTRTFMNGMSVMATLMVIGFIVRGVHGELVGVESPIPSPADLFHLPAYGVFLALAIFVHRARSPRRNPDAWLDAGIGAVALFIVVWVGFFAEYLLGDIVSTEARLVNGAYNIVIFATFTVYLRITATPGIRPPAYYLLGVAGFAFFLIDQAATYSLVRGDGLWLTIALSPIVSGLMLLSIRHPGADQLLSRDLDAEATIGPLRLCMLGFAIGSPAALLFLGTDQEPLSRAILLGTASLLAVLVILRVIRLLQDQRRIAALDRHLVNELGHLSTQRSRAKILDELPGAVERLVDRKYGVVYAAVPHDYRTFPLPTALVGEGRRAIQLKRVDESFRPATRRAIDSLLANAGLLVDALEGREALARQAAEAETNRRVAASERRFRALVEQSSDLIVVADAAGRIQSVSDAVYSMLGLDPADLLGHEFAELLHEDDIKAFTQTLVGAKAETGQAKVVEVRGKNADGSSRLLRCVITNMLDVEEVSGLVLNATDLTERRRLEREVLDAKVTDRLTHLPNRAGFLQKLENAVRHADVVGSSLTVATISVGDLSAVSDALTIDTADHLRQELADTIRRTIRPEDVVARLGDNDFGVLMVHDLESSGSPVASIAAVERVLAILRLPQTVGGHELSVQVEAGLAFQQGDEAEASSILRASDIALTVARETAPSSGVVLFEPEMAERASKRLELRTGMMPGLERGEFRLVYQPVVDMRTGRIKSFEALARWQHPKLGPVSPGVFIEIAEKAGYINPLGEWALQTACRQLQSWRSHGYDDFGVGVNLSVQQLHEPDIVERVARIVDGEGVDPATVTIEVTESVLIDDSDVAASRMQALRRAGFALAIDDFGTGYSSLGYLQRYEFDILKIDKVFVDPLVDRAKEREQEVVRSIVALAQGLGARTVAEGIEEQVQLEVLQELGCDLAQGYLLARPTEASACPELLTSDLLPRLPSPA
jgi:PAS domain S-box-containing protein/diguanylate cyclase (GGDEF)-like protein